jgi:hypothetical protein
VEANEEDEKESTSIGESGESPSKTGEGGRDKTGIVCGDSLFRGVLLDVVGIDRGIIDGQR